MTDRDTLFAWPLAANVHRMCRLEPPFAADPPAASFVWRWLGDRRFPMLREAYLAGRAGDELGDDVEAMDLRRAAWLAGADDVAGAPRPRPFDFGQDPAHRAPVTPEEEARRKARLRALGLTKADTARIKALAESVTPNRIPARIALDAPWYVQAVPAGEERWSSGEPVGSWAGCTLVVWPRTA